MVADSPDHTSTFTRNQQIPSPFPVTGNGVGKFDFNFTPDIWARALIVVTYPPTATNYITVTGVNSGLRFLSAAPQLDGGVYIVPIVPLIDATYTVEWNVTVNTNTTTYVIELDEFPTAPTLWWETPNRLPALFNGAIAGNATQSLLAAVVGTQYRLHQLMYTNQIAAATTLSLQDTGGTEYARFTADTGQGLIIPLRNLLVGSGLGVGVKNLTATGVSATEALTLWYSIA